MIKIAFTVVVLAIVAVLLWIGWRFQPWMASGQTVRITSERLDDFEFQVWQRKNHAITEPFATGLFVHKKDEAWRVFLLDFEDTYLPRILLQKQGSQIAIFRGSRKVGSFDEKNQTFTRETDGAVVSPAVINGEPPANWWLPPVDQATRTNQ
jgi:hypothetical protein